MLTNEGRDRIALTDSGTKSLFSGSLVPLQLAKKVFHGAFFLPGWILSWLYRLL